MYASGYNRYSGDYKLTAISCHYSIHCERYIIHTLGNFQDICDISLNLVFASMLMSLTSTQDTEAK